MNAIQPNLTAGLASARVGEQDRLLAQGINPQDIKQVRESAEAFESILFEQMFKVMRDSIPKDGLIDGGNGEDIYRSMLDAEYAKMMASQKNTGLSGTIERQLFDALSKQSKTAGVSAGHEAYQRQAALDPLHAAEKQRTIEIGVE